jgi:hypothetical protein
VHVGATVEIELLIDLTPARLNHVLTAVSRKESTYRSYDIVSQGDFNLAKEKVSN